MGNIPWLQYIRLFAFQLVQQAVFIFCRRSILNVLSVGIFSMYVHICIYKRETSYHEGRVVSFIFSPFSVILSAALTPSAWESLPYKTSEPVAANLCAWGSLSVPKRMFFTHYGEGSHHFLHVFLRFCGPYFSVIGNVLHWWGWFSVQVWPSASQVFPVSFSTHNPEDINWSILELFFFSSFMYINHVYKRFLNSDNSHYSLLDKHIKTIQSCLA